MFERTEFQHRGSSHKHLLLWLIGAPNIQNLDDQTEEQKQAIIEYFDKLVSACRIEPGERLSTTLNPLRINFTDVSNHEAYQMFDDLCKKHVVDYELIINKVQRHTICGEHCLRKIRNSRTLLCRFKYPIPTIESSRLVRNENGIYQLELKRNDERMNKHSPSSIIHWRGNTDATPIVDNGILAHYLTKYVSKAEPASSNLNNMQGILNSIRTSDRTAVSFIQSILIKQCALRDYSAQECAYLLLNLRFYKFYDRKFIKINLSPDAFIPLEQENNQFEREPELLYGSRLDNFEIARPRGRQALND